MTETAKAKMAAIVAGLDGVTPGPWSIKPDHQHPEDVHHVVGPSKIVVGLDGICSPHRMSDRTFREDMANMAHIARCSPDNIRTLASYIRHLEEENSRMAKALEEARKRMRNAWGAVSTGQIVDKDVLGTLWRGAQEIDAALSSRSSGSGE